MTVNNPLDLILALLPSLSDKDKSKLAEALGTGGCTKGGHNYKKDGEFMESFWKPKKTRYICTRCGDVKLL